MGGSSDRINFRATCRACNRAKSVTNTTRSASIEEIEMSNRKSWPFDQAPNVAAMTTRQVIEQNSLIRQVVHYGDDCSWAFLCGTTEEREDYRLVHMAELLNRDSSLRSIADLPPGWQAWRDSKDSPWERSLEDHEEE